MRVGSTSLRQDQPPAHPLPLPGYSPQGFRFELRFDFLDGGCAAHTGNAMPAAYHFNPGFRFAAASCSPPSRQEETRAGVRSMALSENHGLPA